MQFKGHALIYYINLLDLHMHYHYMYQLQNQAQLSGMFLY